MHVLVFEPARQGHHLTFLRYVLEDLLALGHTVSLAAETGPQPSPELRDALGALLPRCTWIPLRNGAARFWHGRKLDAVTQAQRTARADLVFFNCFDQISSALFRRTALGLPPPRDLHGRVSGIFVRPRVADARLEHTAGDRWKHRGFRRLYTAGWFNRLFVLDETLPAAVDRAFDPTRFPVLPDPWDGDFSVTAAEARRQLGLPADTFLVLHYGTASRRKGLPTLIAAMQLLPKDSRCAIVCAGRFTTANPEPALAELAASGRAFLFPRYIEPVEEPLFFRACNAVVLAYEGHYGSSGVLARAAAADHPVITSDEGLVAERTRAQRLGITFVPADSDDLANAMLFLRDAPPAEFSPGLRTYAARHSRAAFRTALAAGLSAFPLKT